jgi:hypothetical protein
LRLEVRNYVVFPLDELGFFVAQGIFGGLKSLTKIFDTRNIFFSLFASFLAGLKFFSKLLARSSARRITSERKNKCGHKT